MVFLIIYACLMPLPCLASVICHMTVMNSQKVEFIMLRITSYELRVADYELRITNSELRVASCGLRVASFLVPTLLRGNAYLLSASFIQ